jgi:putative cell wall-binding protein
LNFFKILPTVHSTLQRFPSIQRKARTGAVTLAAFALVATQVVGGFSVHAQEPVPVVPTISASLATAELNVGPGQTYSTLQAALDAIPGTPSENYRVRVHPGTYYSESLLSGKNTGAHSAAIIIENAASAKPIFTGAETRGSGTWTAAPGFSDIYYTSITGAKAVTDRNERLKQVANINELQRTTNAWFNDGGAVYVRLVDLVSPNTRALHIITGEHGLRVVGVPNVLVEGLLFEHYGRAGLWFENSGNSSARSVGVEDIGRRGADDAGVLITNSPNSSALNIVGTSILGSAVRLVNSGGAQIYNGSFHRDVVGIDLVNSVNVFLQNNVFGSLFELPLRVDAASKSGLISTKNTYSNPSGILGEIGGAVVDTVPGMGGLAGGESGSTEGDPLFRGTTTNRPSEVNFLHNTTRDLDVSLDYGMAWATQPDAAQHRWDLGFLWKAYMDMYRATRDVRWLQRMVPQVDAIWAQAYDNPSSPGASPDGYKGTSTSRYSVAIGTPSTIVTTGGQLRLVESNGTVLQPPNDSRRIYGPGVGDNIPNKTLELRWGPNPSRFEIWDVTGVATCIGNCGYTSDNYPGGSANVTVTDATIDGAASYSFPFQIASVPPQVGDVYRIQFKAKKQLEYQNIDAGLFAPTVDFATEILRDPTIQQIPVAGTTLLAKANEYVNNVGTHIFPKWEFTFKDLASTPGTYGGAGGVYTFPCDEHYSLPCNTLPMNMQADMARLWAEMWEATGDSKYASRAGSLGAFLNSKLQLRTAADGNEYYFANYYYQTGTWDNWAAVIPDDVNHFGVVVDGIRALREANLGFTETDLVRLRNSFTSAFWDPVNARIYWYLDKTTPQSYATTIYYFHDFANLPGGEVVAKLINDVYASNSYNTKTGVIYQMMAEAALKMSRQPGGENYRVRSGSNAIKSGNTHNYDEDFDGRSRSALGVFDRGAFSYITLDRVSGSNRFKTAIEISKNQFKQDGTAQSVILARGDNYADGLAGAPFARQENGPILLTKTGELLPEVLTEIKRVLPSGGKIWVLGGTSAIADGVIAALQAEGYQVERISGVDRYATAVAVAGKLKQLTDVFLASGLNFPDALAASSIAANKGAAILLTKKSSLTTATSTFLGSIPAEKIHIVGGTAVIDATAEKEAKKYGTVDRTSGANRYATSVELAKKFYPGADTVGFATGLSFPDSLAAGPWTGSSQVVAPLILVQTGAVPKEVKAYLSTYGPQIMGGFLFGGTAAVTDATKKALEAAL